MLKDDPLWVLGAMSGTSMDGVDAAMLLTDGEAIHGFGRTGYRPMTRPSARCWPRRRAAGRTRTWPKPRASCRLPMRTLLSSFDGRWLVGFHGQTLAHDPQRAGHPPGGDGAALAAALGLPVVWDFRSADIRFGGEGAPLAPFYHFACAQWIGAPGAAGLSSTSAGWAT